MIVVRSKMLCPVLLSASIAFFVMGKSDLGNAAEPETLDASLSTWMAGSEFPQGCPLWFGGRLEIKENLRIYKAHRDAEWNLKINKRRGKAAHDATTAAPSYRHVTVKNVRGRLPWRISVTCDGTVIGDDWDWGWQPQNSAFPTQAVIEFIAFPQNQRVNDRLPVGKYEIAVAAELAVTSNEVEPTCIITAKPLHFTIHGGDAEDGEPHDVTRARCWKHFIDKVSQRYYPEYQEVKSMVEQLPMYRYVIFEEKRRHQHEGEKPEGGPGSPRK